MEMFQIYVTGQSLDGSRLLLLKIAKHENGNAQEPLYELGPICVTKILTLSYNNILLIAQ